MKTSISGILAAYADLNLAHDIATSGPRTPHLSTYSPVPSLQSLANQHSSAIEGSTGCAILVVNAIGHEIEWSTNNLKAIADSIGRQEDNIKRGFEVSAPKLNPSVEIQYAHNFTARPEFQVGNLSFHAASLTNEIAIDAEKLLGLFESTRDEEIIQAISFWESTSHAMSTISDTIHTIASRLSAEHEGEAFAAASNQLEGLSKRINLVSESSDIMANSLSPMPYIRSNATTNLREILSRSRNIEDPTAREEFLLSETQHYLTNGYLTQLQEVVPKLSSLTTPHHAGILRSEFVASAQYVEHFDVTDHQTSRLTGSTFAAATTAIPQNAPAVAANSPLPSLSPGLSALNPPNGLVGITENRQSLLAAVRPHGFINSPESRAATGLTRPNSLRTGASPLATQTTVNRGATGPSANLSDRRVSTNMPRNAGSPMMGVPAPARLPESPGTASRLLGTPQSSGGANGQPIHGNTASDRNRSPAGGALRGGTSIAPVSSLGSSGKRSTSPIGQVSKLRRNDSTNANHKRLFGSTGPTVPEILGADLRD